MGESDRVCDAVPNLLVQIRCKPQLDSQKTADSDKNWFGLDTCNALRCNALRITRAFRSGTSPIQRCLILAHRVSWVC
jgi:hypothetical protein